ncbi:amidohydrolase family protein [Salinibacter grassmerensis]|uniref:amidohydrolase family protein n=1 Tax=Salinibacter grassmerensis TaxID=3040353 RepID=UPI0021E8AA1A|nr:amidohydrolase family protein [Salinibacter grassmerensis]
MSRPVVLVLSLLFTLGLGGTALVQSDSTPEAAPDRERGAGPYDRLVIRGATLIDGTGAPPRGPVDIVVQGDSIAQIVAVGAPDGPINEEARPEAGNRELDASGMHVLPGFVDLHAHLGGTAQSTPAEYVLKLWMAHGVTTAREVAAGNGLGWTLRHRKRSAANEITAPRLVVHPALGTDREAPITTPQQARAWVQRMAEAGADGLKFFEAPPDVLKAALQEADAQGLRTAMHHAQPGTPQYDVLDTATWGLTTGEHFYGYPEALYTDRSIQDYPPEYNYQDEEDRFAYAGRMWQQAAAPGSRRWTQVLDSLRALDFTMVPTFGIYEANRDLMRGRRAEWHDTYTLPSLWDFFHPSFENHGSYHYFWSTADEAAWDTHFDRWMQFVQAHKNRGGRVGVGSDSGYIFKLYGFGYVRELELLQEAGFEPLEVIRSATLEGAQALGQADEIGSVEVGKQADLVLVDENPLANLKVLYGTGALRFNKETRSLERAGGVDYTIKDGIVFEAERLLQDVEQMVRTAKEAAGMAPDANLELTQ